MVSLKNNRKKLLPWVEDWASSQDHIRLERNINKLSYNDWFWCHPSAYTLIYYGNSFLSLAIFISASLYFFYREIMLLSILFGGLTIYALYKLIKKLNLRELNRGKTFYDQYLRDDELIEVIRQ